MKTNATEIQVRCALRKAGYILHKSRKRNPTYYDEGNYMIIDMYINGCVAGSRFDYTLEDVIEWINDYL